MTDSTLTGRGYERFNRKTITVRGIEIFWNVTVFEGSLVWVDVEWVKNSSNVTSCTVSALGGLDMLNCPRCKLFIYSCEIIHRMISLVLVSASGAPPTSRRA